MVARKRGNSAGIWAELLFPHIPYYPDAPASAAALRTLTGLTQDQIYRAAAYLRDNYPSWSLVSTAHDGYRWSEQFEDVEGFQRTRARSAHTTIRRLWTGVMKPYLGRAGEVTGRERKIITREFERLLEDIGSLVQV